MGMVGLNWSDFLAAKDGMIGQRTLRIGCRRSIVGILGAWYYKGKALKSFG